MNNQKVFMAGAGVALVVYLVASKAVTAGAGAVENTRQSWILSIVDWLSDVTGLTAEQDRILTDPAYAEYENTLG